MKKIISILVTCVLVFALTPHQAMMSRALDSEPVKHARLFVPVRMLISDDTAVLWFRAIYPYIISPLDASKNQKLPGASGSKQTGS